MTRKEAIKACKAAIKELVSESKAERGAIRKEIRTLKWKPEATEELPKLRAAQKLVSKGERQDFKELRAAIKALKRPETGPKRYDLWNAKRGSVYCDRTTFYAYAILRGRSRASMERSIVKPGYAAQLAFWTLNSLQSYWPECPWTKADIEAWILGSDVKALTWEQAA